MGLVLNPVVRLFVYESSVGEVPTWCRMGDSSVVADQDALLFGIFDKSPWFFGVNGLLTSTHIAFITNQIEVTVRLNLAIGHMI